MVLTVCPSCGERKFLEQFQKCTACGHGVRDAVVLTVAVGTNADGEVVSVSAKPLPGESCPTCGKRMAMTKAQTQKAYRAKLKAEKS